MLPSSPVFRCGPAGLLALLAGLLVFSLESGASGPRLNKSMFEIAIRPLVVAYEMPPYLVLGEGEGGPVASLVSAAFKAAGKDVGLDIRPSRQLAKLLLGQLDEGGILGLPSDFSVAERERLLAEVVYVFKTPEGDTPLTVYLPESDKNAALRQAFRQGLDKLVENGDYLSILTRFHGDDRAAREDLDRLLAYRK